MNKSVRLIGKKMTGFTCVCASKKFIVKKSVVKCVVYKYKVVLSIFVGDPAIACKVLVTLVALHLLTLLRGSPDVLDCWVIDQFLVGNPDKQRMGVQVLHHPKVKILHITDRIDDSTGTENVCIL